MATTTRHLTTQMAALKQAWRRTDRLMDALCAEADVHARSAAAARAALAAAFASHDDQRQTGDTLRREQQLVDAVGSAAARLRGGADDPAGFRLCLHTLEGLAPRCNAEGDAPRTALASATRALGERLGQVWLVWLDGPDAATLLDGARSLALAPPGSLSLGVDGLEEEHAAKQVLFPLSGPCLRPP